MKSPSAHLSRHFLRGVAPALSLSLALCGFIAADIAGIRSAFIGPGATRLAQVVGVSVGVPENEFNTLAQGIAQRQEELDERERDLAAREAQAAGGEQSFRRATLLLSAISFVLLVLILLNYFADWRRRKDAQ
jgi:hypothetical protein